MRLDKLQIDLRPRPNAQALDLGFALLRSHAASVYTAWLALWLPLTALCGVLAYLLPGYGGVWMVLAWWLKPLLERAPLYILSRQVFGEAVTWQDALRAWPKQLGGGWFRLLTWWRPFAAGRGLYQPIWQLEGARGKVAAERRKVIGKNNTAQSAFWFGVVCVHFSAILQLGLVAFIGIFLSNENVINPFSYLFGNGEKLDSPLVIVVTFTCYALAEGIIGPIYSACCFTLYLNRRATLEAWDIEIMLRQIKPPGPKNQRAGASGLLLAPLCGSLLAPVMLALILGHSAATEAAVADTGKCEAPEWLSKRKSPRSVDQSPDQARLRDEVSQLFDSDDLRGYVCKESWVLKNPRKNKPEDKSDISPPNLKLLAEIIKTALIAFAILAVGWLLYRYRDKFPSFARKPRAAIATEVGGLDIRAETLPGDVAGTARQLWARGERRAALALLYRATLSRLVNEDSLLLTRGATEGDCLRLAHQACKRKLLSEARLQVVASATDLWLNGAYGNRWPDTDTVNAACAVWQARFGTIAEDKAAQP